MAPAHTIGDAVEAGYRRDDLIREASPQLQRLAQHDFEACRLNPDLRFQRESSDECLPRVYLVCLFSRREAVERFVRTSCSGHSATERVGFPISTNVRVRDEEISG